MRNKEIRKEAGLRKLDLIIKERGLRLGHVLRMEDSRNGLPHQAIQRKPGQPRQKWMDTVKRDLKDMDITWDEAEELATNRAEWCQTTCGPMNPSGCGMN